MKAKYQQLLARGKAKKVALVALMREIIVCLNAMVKKGQGYAEEASCIVQGQ